MGGRFLVGILLAATLALAAGCGRAEDGQPRLPLYVFVADGAPDASWEALLPERYRGEVSYLVPYWYVIRADGSLEDGSDPGLKEFARAAGLRLQPSFSVADGEGAFLLNPAVRSRAVANIAATVLAEGYEGANVRWDPPEPAHREAFASFVAELADRLHAGERRLTLTVRPGDDLAGVAHRADAVILLAYGREGSRPGPLAPLERVEEEARAAVRAAGDPARVVLGLAAVGWDWALGSTAPPREIPGALAKSTAEEQRSRVLRARDGTPHYFYEEGGWRHEVWFEDGRSLVVKLRAAKRMKLGGVAVWSLGYLDAEYWEALRRNR